MTHHENKKVSFRILSHDALTFCFRSGSVPVSYRRCVREIEIILLYRYIKQIDKFIEMLDKCYISIINI